MLHFPKIQSIEVNNFSLYKKKNPINVDVDRGVVCLAGANGLGKSTFISIVNYALTGIVADASKSFSAKNSIQKFYTDNKRFAQDYFDGRVEGKDIELAEVTIRFSINGNDYELTRGFFEQDSLRHYTRKANGIVSKSEKTNSQNHVKYTQELVVDMDLSSFDQFVFLQYFLFTFDESRQLLFWDTTIMERVLYLFFGLDSVRASIADQLRKDITRLGSNIRNLRWDTTQLHREIDRLNENKQDSAAEPGDDIVEEYKELEQSVDDSVEEINKLNSDVNDVNVKLSSLSLEINALKSEYKELFAKRYDRKSVIKNNLIITDSINRNVCQLCHADDVQAIENIKALLDAHVCPLCSSALKNSENKSQEGLVRLQEIDTILIDKNEELNHAIARQERLTNRLRELESLVLETRQHIEKFQSDFPSLIVLGTEDESADKSTVTRLYERIAVLDKQRADDIKKRDNKQKLLKEEEKIMSKSFLAAEEEFIPIFMGYARQFIGLDLEISLNRSARGVSLSLDVSGQTRKVQYQLSESQRYFLDIALRMALIDYSQQVGCLLIDTPEGSLDIAYESRAGRMFADFANAGHDIIMTANINSSQLLLQLAAKCEPGNMQLVRMTNWSVLTEIQMEERVSINEAYKAIEEKMQLKT